MKNRTSRHGVTLVEMLVVMAILMMLAGLVAVVWRSLDVQTKEKALQNTLTILDNALTEYKDQDPNDRFPVQTQRDPNDALVHSQFLYKKLDSVYASREVLYKLDGRWLKNLYLPEPNDVILEIYDPWEMPIDYVYVSGDSFFLLRSAGPDKRFGTADDIFYR